MIEADHFWLHRLFFSHYFRFILWKDFRKIEISGEFSDRGLPVMLIGNHISWWDGFFSYELNRTLFKRRFYLMMLEEQLKKISFFRKLGAFSIDPGSRSAIKSVNYASEILKSSGNILIIFPQGKIKSQYTTEMAFLKGWFRILKNAGAPVHVVFMANLTDYFSCRKPTLYVYLEDYPLTEGFILDDLSESYNLFYQRCLERQKQLS